MQDPLTPPDCDLRGLPFMPLDVVRLVDSDLTALATGEEFKAAIMLWCKSWLQVPAASLPDDDRILAHLSGTGSRWPKVRDIALRNFVKCSDGRLYHSTVAEKANDAWERRGEWQERQNNKTERQKRWRNRQKELSDRLRDLGITPPKGASLETLEGLLVDAGVDGSVDADASTVDAVEMPLTGTVTGTGTNSVVSAQPRASRLSKPFDLPEEWAQWAITEKRWSSGDVKDEAARFADYWHAKPGKDGTKLDWQATWRNWVRGSKRTVGSSASLVNNDAFYASLERFQ